MPTTTVARSPSSPCPGEEAAEKPAMMPMTIVAMRSPIIAGLPRADCATRDPSEWSGTSHFPGAMSLDDPVILTCSISGAVANREQCPAIPYTPEEYAAEARRIVDEGGSMIHIHARTPDGTPSYEVEDFRAITEAILAEVGDVVINYSTGAIGVPVEKRIAYLRELRPDVGALNMGSMNYAKYSRRRKEFVFSFVFENSFDTIRALLERDERVRDPARARVLRLRPPRQPRPAAGHGRAAPAAAGLVRDGRDGRDPADRAQPRPHGRAGPRRAARVGRDRRLARPVDAGGGGALARRQRARRAGGQLLPARRRDGPLQRRPDRAGAADGRGQRPARGDGGRGAAAARACASGRRWRERGRSRACGSSTSRGCCRAASARCCWPTSAPT